MIRSTKGALLAALAASVPLLHAPATADACIGPELRWHVEQTSPEDGGTLAPGPGSIVLQLRPEYGYAPDGVLGEYDPQLAMWTLTTAMGEDVAAGELTTERVPDSDWLFAHLSLPELGPSTTYVFTTWVEEEPTFSMEFQTSESPLEPPMPVEALTATFSRYFDTRPVVQCCPEQFVGECPRCYDIGDEPIGAVSASFEPLDPREPARHVYQLEYRADASDTWRVATTGALGHGAASLSAKDVRFSTERYCLRVVAYDVEAPEAPIVGDDECLDPPPFDSAPPRNVDHDLLQCDEDADPEDPVHEGPDDDEVEEDNPVDESVSPKDDDEETDEPSGWEFEEEGGMGADGGCCASASGAAPPLSSALWGLLLGGVLWRRRR